MTRLLPVWIIVTFALPAAAQGTFASDTEAGFGMQPTWSVAHDLNWAGCENTGAVKITLTPDATQLIADDAYLDAFFDSDGNCQGDPPDASDTDRFIAHMTIPAGDTFLTSRAALGFPADIDDENGDPLAFTTGDVYDHLPDSCTDTRQGRTSFAICITVDMPSDVGVGPNGTISSSDGDWYAWVKLTVDTQPPPAPDTPTVVPLDGRLRLKAEITADGETDDIAEWRAIIRPLDDATAGQACDDWATTKEETVNDAGTSASIEVQATNGVTYEACVIAIDSLGNESTGSPVVTGTPEAECDFIECYPGNLKTGYCGAASAPAWAGLGILLLVGRRRKTERDR